MNHPLLKDSTPSVQIIFSALVVVGTWLAFQVFAILSGMVIFSVGMEQAIQMMTNMHNPQAVSFLKYVQGVTSVGLFIVSSFIIALFIDYQVADYLYLRKYPGKLSLLLVGLMVIFILPFSNLTTELNRQLTLPESLSGIQNYFENKENQMEDIMQTFLKVNGFWALMGNILVIAIIPAVGEELLFRGIFQKLFTALTKSPHTGIIIAAFIFSALHLQFFSFLPRFLLGMIFGYLVYWSGSLWPAILAHFINNFMAVIYYYFYYGGKTELELEYIGSPGHALYLGIISLFISLVLLYGIRKSLKEQISPAHAYGSSLE